MQIRFTGEALLPEGAFRAFEEFMMFVYEDCCAGGVDAQHDTAEQSSRSLRELICGPSGTKSGAASPVAGGGGPSKLEKLRCALSETVQHLNSGLESLGLASGLGSQPLEKEKAGLAELSTQVKRHLEEVESQIQSDRAKRPRVE